MAWDEKASVKPLYYKGPFTLKTLLSAVEDWAKAHGFDIFKTKFVDKGDEVEVAYLLEVRRRNIFEESITLTIKGVDVSCQEDSCTGKLRILIEGSYKVVSKRIIWHAESRLHTLFDWLTKKPLYPLIKKEFIDAFEKELVDLQQAVKKALGLPAFTQD